MDISMLKKALFLLLMIGCAKHPVTSEDPQGLLKFAGSNFTSTSSICLDGVIVALDHVCTKPIEIYDGYPYVSIRCNKVGKESPPWDQYNIIAVTHTQATTPPGSEMICADPAARVFLQELPK